MIGEVGQPLPQGDQGVQGVGIVGGRSAVGRAAAVVVVVAVVVG